MASKVSPSLYLADQDLSISPQGVVKWKDLDQQERDWVCSLMPQSIRQSDGVLYANSRRCTEKSYVTYYKCRACKAASVGTLMKDSSEPTIRLVRPHSCSTESSPEQPLVFVANVPRLHLLRWKCAQHQ